MYLNTVNFGNYLYLFLNKLNFLERWLSGLKRRFAKSLYNLFYTVGSNPTLSNKTKSILYMHNLEFNNYLNLNNSFLYFEFLPVLLFIAVAIVLALIIVSLSYLLAIQNPETEKLSSYECGFEPYEDARNIFDVKFYIVAILFIIFDIETMFLLPWSVSISQLDVLGFWSMIDFIIELGVGFIYIWYIGALEWE